MRSKYKLPNRLMPLSNPDKEGWHEKWKSGRNMLNIPHPYRMMCLGPPNVGKSTVIKNLIVRADPPFEKIVVCHGDPDYTQEYDDLGSEDVEIRGDIPEVSEWEGDCKTLCIIDDLEFKSMSKDQNKCLDRLFGYVSTHKNVSVILAAQDAFAVPSCARRCSNIFVLWRIVDLDSMSNVARKTSLKSANLRNIFDNICTEFRDSLWIDLTCDSPYKLRRNGFQKITQTDGKDTLKQKEKQDKFDTF